ncbi:MAG: hypothetical protein WCR20_23480, partial [Verrucomicrobiota bacterium]
MISLPPPRGEDGLPLAPLVVFERCISSIRSADLRNRLKGISGTVQSASADYDKAASGGTLFEIVPRESLQSVTKGELIKVYDQQMVGKKKPARPFYDKILNQPRWG